MTGFPPRERLAHVVRSLVIALPRDYATLLAAERFAEAREAVTRLGNAERLAAAIAATTPGEADALADRILERWTRLGPVRLEPAVAILGPAEIWIGDTAQDTLYRVAATGLDPDWSALWSGDAAALPDGRTATLALPSTAFGSGGHARLAVRVMGRHASGRCILTTDRVVTLRRLCVRLDATRRKVWLHDSDNRAAAGLAAKIGDVTYVTNEAGTFELPVALPPRTTIDVGGARVECP
jgi:hypothetical protein